MGSGKQLLLFAVLPLLVRGQQPQVGAKLSIETGRPVMSMGGAVILKLENGNPLKGWRCWVSRDGGKPKMVQLRLEGINNSISFQTMDLNVPETTYWCTDKSRTYRSNNITLRTSANWNDEEGVGVGVGVWVGLVLGLVGLGAVLVGVLLMLKHKRTATGRVYEEVALSSRKQGDDNYQTLKASGMEREYDTLKSGASGSQTKSGEYEALKKEGMKEGVYHTLGVEGAAGGEGGYEALKKEGMKAEVYHTLGVEGAAGGEGGYEALKKEGMKAEVYHTLGAESQ